MVTKNASLAENGYYYSKFLESAKKGFNKIFVYLENPENKNTMKTTILILLILNTSRL
jgi:hypothetical protein